MNIFLPYEEDIEKSVQSLDDRRLVKQVMECKILLDIALGKKSGYANHPVSKHYKDFPAFLIQYGLASCKEYEHRYNKTHQYLPYFLEREEANTPPNYIPYYAAGSIKSPDCIRTTDNVSVLFQQKLIQKWDDDTGKGRAPKWTNRGAAEFYVNSVE